MQILVDSTSLRIEVDFDRLSLNCRAAYNLALFVSEASTKPIDLAQHMDFILHARQLDITDITLVPLEGYDFFEIVEKEFLPPKKQAIAYKVQKGLKFPCSYISINYMLNRLRQDLQKILIRIKFRPDRLPSTDQDYLRELCGRKQLFQIQISYSINQPVAGLRFLVNRASDQVRKFLITEKHYQNANNWMPVPLFRQQVFKHHSEQDRCLLYFKKLIVIVDSDYFVICSGTLQEQFNLDETCSDPKYDFPEGRSKSSMKVFVYDISEYMNPDDVGVFVGQFLSYQVQISDDFKLNVYHLRQPKAQIWELDEVKQLFENLDRVWFKDPLLQKARDKLRVASGSSFFSQQSVLILPGIYQPRYFSFYPFRNMLVFDDLQVPNPIPCKETWEEFMKILTLQLNCLILKQFLATSVNVSDRWIELGFIFWASWHDKYSDINAKVVKQIKLGADVRLNFFNKKKKCEYFPQVFVLESEEYQIKTRMLTSILARMTRQDDKFIKEILIRFYQDSQGDVPAALTTEVMRVCYKKSFCIKKSEQFLKYYAHQLGGWHFRVAYDQDRESKLALSITQYPLIGPWAEAYSKNYLMGIDHACENKPELTLLSDQTMTYRKTLHDLEDTHQKIHNTSKEIEQLKQDDCQRISNKTLNDFKRKEYQIHSLAMLPEELCNEFAFQGNVKVNILETNELKLEDLTEDAEIENKIWSKVELNRPNKVKKTSIPKRHLEINATNYIDRVGENGMMEAENDPQNVQTPVIRGTIDEAIMSSAAQIKEVEEMKQAIQKDPPLWIKFDPEGFMVKEVDYLLSGERSVVNCQILKEKDLAQIACVLRSIKDLAFRADCVKLIVESIECSYQFLKSEDMVILLDLLRELVNGNYHDRTKKGLKHKFEKSDDLQAFLRLSEKIVYRFFFSQYDNSVKVLKFSNESEYNIINQLLKSLAKLSCVGSQGYHLSLRELLIKVLNCYDNSLNHVDCQRLMGRLVKALLKSNCHQQKYQVLTATLQELKKVIYQRNPKNYILKCIIIYYDTFISNNFRSITDEIIKDQFLRLHNEIKSILETYRRVFLPNQDNFFIEMAFYKIQLMQEFESMAPYPFVLHQLSHITNVRLRRGYTSMVFHSYLQQLQKFIQKNYRTFAEALAKSEADNDIQETLAYTMFEQIISGVSILNLNVQYCFMSIYRNLYYYFAPICYQRKIKEKYEKKPKEEFYSWIGFNNQSDFAKKTLDELLSQYQQLHELAGTTTQKKKASARTNNDLETCLQSLVEKNKEKIDEKEIIKQILKHLNQYPRIKNLDEKEGGIEKISQVKNQTKRKSPGLEEIQTYILNIVKQHLTKGNIDQENYGEYCDLIRQLFQIGARYCDKLKQEKKQLKLQAKQGMQE